MKHESCQPCSLPVGLCADGHCEKQSVIDDLFTSSPLMVELRKTQKGKFNMNPRAIHFNTWIRTLNHTADNASDPDTRKLARHFADVLTLVRGNDAVASYLEDAGQKMTGDTL